MIYAGIDVGSMSAEAVLIEGDRILASKVIVVKPNPVVSATLVMEAVLEEAGLRFSGLSPDGELPEIVEFEDHPWFIGVQFHPELKSKPYNPHPLFTRLHPAVERRGNRVIQSVSAGAF